MLLIRPMRSETENQHPIDLQEFTAARIDSLKSLVELVLKELEFLQRANIGDDEEDAVPRSFNKEVQYFEEQLIRNALMVCNGNQRRAARMLDMKPNTLNVKMKRYGISPEVVFASSKDVSDSLHSAPH
jgi:DNA-binding NtrC family response regulator